MGHESRPRQEKNENRRVKCLLNFQSYRRFKVRCNSFGRAGWRSLSRTGNPPSRDYVRER